MLVGPSIWTCVDALGGLANKSYQCLCVLNTPALKASLFWAKINFAGRTVTVETFRNAKTSTIQKILKHFVIPTYWVIFAGHDGVCRTMSDSKAASPLLLVLFVGL